MHSRKQDRVPTKVIFRAGFQIDPLDDSYLLRVVKHETQSLYAVELQKFRLTTVLDMKATTHTDWIAARDKAATIFNQFLANGYKTLRTIGELERSGPPRVW